MLFRLSIDGLDCRKAIRKCNRHVGMGQNHSKSLRESMTIMMLATRYCILIYFNAKIGVPWPKCMTRRSTTMPKTNKSHGKQPAIMNSPVMGIQLKQGSRLGDVHWFFPFRFTWMCLRIGHATSQIGNFIWMIEWIRAPMIGQTLAHLFHKPL